MGEDIRTPPEGRLIRQPSDAEYVVRDWLKYWGQIDAIRIGGSGDMGVDVESGDYVVQVKATTGAVGRPVVQQTFGEATHRSKRALVFSLGGFTDEALEWASAANVGLFEFDLQGTPLPINIAASELATSSPSTASSASRTLVGSVSEVRSQLDVTGPLGDAEHVLILGNETFCQDVASDLEPDLVESKDSHPSKPIDDRESLLVAPKKDSHPSKTIVWRYDSRIHDEVDLAGAIVNTHPGNKLVVVSIENLPHELARTLVVAVKTRQMNVVLGKGPTEQAILIDLPEFQLVGISTEPGRMPRDLLNLFDRWLIQQSNRS